MCLAVPAKVEKLEGEAAVVDMAGNRITADISLVPETRIGDYVIVHAGLAIERYDEDEALDTLELLRRLGENVLGDEVR
ncbi:MAG: HypC/HybG/HupF family hydrogenase formation chaperone [Chitinivibrionales bacterium]|nr:HypC/HybG/HupF family hydrogenase formation chaperone [Chitinivibrionales bacterium]MBD3356286.1 HypC/HybG/HupF family hydrogenase formation chaperone [Chitinivibrionales bacterium]